MNPNFTLVAQEVFPNYFPCVYISDDFGIGSYLQQRLYGSHDITLLLYSKIGVYSGKHYFLIFALKSLKPPQ